MALVRTSVNRWAILTPTILLVEDSPVQKLANEKILIRAGYLVLLAVDGQEAVRLAREANPTLCCWIWVCLSSADWKCSKP
jgi:CheY-like chemotaxis protein